MNGRILIVLSIIFIVFALSVSVIAAAGGNPGKSVAIDMTIDTNQEAREHFLTRDLNWTGFNFFKNLTADNINIFGNVFANKFFGDGSGLTNLPVQDGNVDGKDISPNTVSTSQLAVSGNSNVTGDLSVNGNLNVDGNLSVSGYTTITGGITMPDKITGQPYCLTINNGALHLASGTCNSPLPIDDNVTSLLSLCGKLKSVDPVNSGIDNALNSGCYTTVAMLSGDKKYCGVSYITQDWSTYGQICLSCMGEEIDNPGLVFGPAKCNTATINFTDFVLNQSNYVDYNNYLLRHLTWTYPEQFWDEHYPPA